MIYCTLNVEKFYGMMIALFFERGKLPVCLDL